jgi:hypothetical protein
MNYSEILKRAWKIIWKFKILWIFGILASCTVNHGGGGGSGGGSSRGGNNFNFGNNSFNNLNQLPAPLRQWGMQLQHLANTGELWTYLVIFFIVLVLLVIVLNLIFLAVGTIGEIGLINGVWDVEEGAGKLSFGALFKKGGKFFWKVILFKILLGVAWFLVAIVTIILAVVTLGCGLILLLPLMLVLSFVVWIVVEMAMVALVAEEMAVFEALEKTWALFKKNWTSSSIMGLILSVVNFVVALVIAIPGILAMLPAIFGVIASSSSRNMDGIGTSIMISIVLLLLYAPIAIFLNGVLVAYIRTAWTLTYRHLTGRVTNEAPVVVDAPPAAELPPVG